MNDRVVIIVGTVVTLVFFVVGVLHYLHVDWKIKVRGILWLAAGLTAQMIMSILLGHTFNAAIHSAGVAFLLWTWWNKGGGDGLKRRLKKWTESLRRSFVPQTA